MPWAKLPARFSSDPIVERVQEKYGLEGYARLVKLLERLAEADPSAEGKVSGRLSGWLSLLQQSQAQFFAFLQFLARCGWVRFEPVSTLDAELTLEFCSAASHLPDLSPTLLSSPEQWAFWCEIELNMPAAMSRTEPAQSYFRRWCASNVTVTEMEAAIEEGARANDLSITPSALNSRLASIRKARLEAAKVGF